MKTLGGFTFGLLAVGCLLAQNRGGFVNPLPITRTPPSVIFPGGTSALPGVQRTTGSVIYPGGGGPQIGVSSPVFNNNLGFRGSQVFGRPAGHPGRRGGAAVYAYPVPVYVGGYGMYDSGYAPYPTEPVAQQPNVTVIMPPQAPPVIINQFGSAAAPIQGQAPAAQETAPVEEPQSSSQQTHYLLAFKDHTIYSAVAYWVDGDTLHYFTSGNTHNQVSIALIDRALTERLNRESGLVVNLPPMK
jgi:hypothetical protein